MTWYQSMLTKILLDSQDSALVTAQGIPLQICDIFLKEMNRVDSDVSLDDLAQIIDPFLKALGKIHSGELKERILSQVFHPLLENNKTKEETSSDEEELEKQEKYHRYVDGGKMPPKTVKEVERILNEKYIFSGFNILIYAQNYILTLASSQDEK